MSGFWAILSATRSFRYAWRYGAFTKTRERLRIARCPARRFHETTSCGCCHTCGYTRSNT